MDIIVRGGSSSEEIRYMYDEFGDCDIIDELEEVDEDGNYYELIEVPIQGILVAPSSMGKFPAVLRMQAVDNQERFIQECAARGIVMLDCQVTQEHTIGQLRAGLMYLASLDFVDKQHIYVLAGNSSMRLAVELSRLNPQLIRGVILVCSDHPALDVSGLKQDFLFVTSLKDIVGNICRWIYCR